MEFITTGKFEVIYLKIKSLRVEQAMRNPCGDKTRNDDGRSHRNCAN